MFTIQFVVICFIAFWYTVLNEENKYIYPLIFVDGKTTPRLSFLSFHVKTNFDCMGVMKQIKIAFYKKRSIIKKIPHVYRVNCI